MGFEYKVEKSYLSGITGLGYGLAQKSMRRWMKYISSNVSRSLLCARATGDAADAPGAPRGDHAVNGAELRVAGREVD
jgi:hypothetical protein